MEIDGEILDCGVFEVGKAGVDGFICLDQWDDASEKKNNVGTSEEQRAYVT